MMNASSGKKQEDGDGEEMRKLGASTSRQWGGFKNPRIVRVSRSFGGKDRHSKVCTIRGLRDRRIRLSVPTAIQLYDLQDRLGLSQPSKVVDWLLHASRLEIDKLPPLHFPPPNSFSQQPNPSVSRSQSGNKEKWVFEETQDAAYNTNVVPQTLFPLGTQSCFPPDYHWEPSSLSLSQFHDSQNNNNLYFPSILPPPYMPPTLPEPTLFHHLLPTPSTSYAKDLSSLPHNNPQKGSRGS